MKKMLNNLDVINFKYEERIIAFIDILGFSNIIKATLNSEKELNNLGSALCYIHDYFKNLQVEHEDPSVIQLSQFSDSIVISVSMEHSLEMTTIFKHLKMIQINLLYKNILLRGGIVKGNLIHTNDLLLGPGMINAYNLESKCALHPRIVIDPKVLWQFGRINGTKQTERLRDFDYEKSFAKETDGTYFIDYFNDVEFYLESGGDEMDYFRLLCNIICKHIDNDDISVRVKYLWLREKLKKGQYFKEYKNIYKEIVTDRHKKVK
jgi:hypothetical protein